MDQSFARKAQQEPEGLIALLSLSAARLCEAESGAIWQFLLLDEPTASLDQAEPIRRIGRSLPERRPVVDAGRAPSHLPLGNGRRAAESARRVLPAAGALPAAKTNRGRPARRSGGPQTVSFFAVLADDRFSESTPLTAYPKPQWF